MVPAICRGDSQYGQRCGTRPLAFYSRIYEVDRFRQKLAGAVDASSAGRDRDMAPRCAEQDNKLTGGARPAVPVVLIHALHHPTTATTATSPGLLSCSVCLSPHGASCTCRSLIGALPSVRASVGTPTTQHRAVARELPVPNAKLPAAARATVQRAGSEFFSLDCGKWGTRRYSPRVSRRCGS